MSITLWVGSWPRSQANMVEIEKSFKIEIEIYRIKIFRTEIKIGFYGIGFLRFCF